MTKRIVQYLFVLMCLVSCLGVPPDIIQPDDMEDLLFDYHLTQGMIDQMSAEQRGNNNQRYLDALFKKHGVTQEEFDSSMVWYNKDGNRLHDIYVHLDERFKELNDDLKLKSGGQTVGFSVSGDTANVWSGNSFYLLRSMASLNTACFNIKNDSTFRKGDEITLYSSVNFVRENKDYNSNIYLNLGINIEYADGTVRGTNHNMEQDDKAILRFNTDKDKEIKSVSGYFFFHTPMDARNIALIRELALVRIHTISKEEATKADTLKTDSLKADTLSKVLPDSAAKAEIIPEEVKQEIQAEKKAKILTAPEVRTRNSIGVRKKKATIAK